jgi:hypothetical protein
MDYIKNFDIHSKNSKLGMAFLVPTILFFILAPGVFFEIHKDNIKKEKKITYVSSSIHAVIFGLINFIFYYFYLSKV